MGRLEERQLLTYLNVGGFPLGYILNFGAPKMVEGIMRRVNNFPESTPPFCGNSGDRRV
jgi:PD-(D/E)XK nuclease superfamily